MIIGKLKNNKKHKGFRFRFEIVITITQNVATCLAQLEIFENKKRKQKGGSKKIIVFFYRKKPYLILA